MKEKMSNLDELTGLVKPHTSSNGHPVSEVSEIRKVDPLSQLEKRKATREWELEERSSDVFNLALLSSGIVLLALQLVLADGLFSAIRTYVTGPSAFSQWIESLWFGWRVAILWAFTIALFSSAYYFRVKLPLARLRNQIKAVKEDIYVLRTASEEGRRRYLQDELRKLPPTIARVFLDSPDRSKLANQWWQRADDILERLAEYERFGNQASSDFATAKAQEAYEKKRQADLEQRIYLDGKMPDLGEAEALISAISELILREENELREQRYWRYAAITIMLAYIVLLGAVVIASRDPNVASATLPVFGIPVSIVMWGAAGSLAAILYRFYTERKRIRFDLEVRWLVARPVIGIIMGAVAYLALKLGIFILNRAPAASGNAATSDLEIYWVVAFLAGFSDKFYLRIIDLLVGKTVGAQAEQGQSPGAGRPGREEQPEQNEEGGGAIVTQPVEKSPPEKATPPANKPKHAGEKKKRR